MTTVNLYTPQYHAAIAPGSGDSASVIVPIVTDLLPCRRVVDVGCGTGAWLAAFAPGADRPPLLLVGVDGEYVDRAGLLIDESAFVAADLNEALPCDRLLGMIESAEFGRRSPSQIRGHQKFDLAMCLEVAEHIRPERSEGFIRDLCELADVVLFSAAIPYQGGEGHINERWPTFWQELFKGRGFELIDPIRKRVWSDRRVEPWYQQNMVIYAHPRAIAAHPRLAEEHRHTFPGFLSLVHPRLYGPLVERAGLKRPGPWVPEGLRSEAKEARP